MTKPLTRDILLSRGSCCGRKCINCPYTPRGQKGSKNVKKKFSTDRYF